MYARSNCERSTHGVKPLAPFARMVLGISLRLSNNVVASPQQTPNPNLTDLTTVPHRKLIVRQPSPTIPQLERRGFGKTLEPRLQCNNLRVNLESVSSTLLQRWITPQAAKPGAFFCVFLQFHAYLNIFGRRSEAHQQGLGQKPRKGML